MSAHPMPEPAADLAALTRYLTRDETDILDQPPTRAQIIARERALQIAPCRWASRLTKRLEDRLLRERAAHAVVDAAIAAATEKDLHPVDAQTLTAPWCSTTASTKQLLERPPCPNVIQLPALAAGDRVRFLHGGDPRWWWDVREAEGRWVVLTHQAEFRPRGELVYTIIDRWTALRGPCDLLGNGWNVGLPDGCEQLLTALQIREVELSRRRFVTAVFAAVDRRAAANTDDQSAVSVA